MGASLLALAKSIYYLYIAYEKIERENAVIWRSDVTRMLPFRAKFVHKSLLIKVPLPMHTPLR